MKRSHWETGRRIPRKLIPIDFILVVCVCVCVSFPHLRRWRDDIGGMDRSSNLPEISVASVFNR